MPTTPTLIASSPRDGATGVPLNVRISAAFSEAMDASTLTVTHFTVTSGAPPVAVAGVITYRNNVATFAANALLAPATPYTVRISTGATSALGIPLAAPATWSFTSGTMQAPPGGVNLGTAGGFAVLAKAGISTVPTSAITGNIGVSPAAATYLTGFSQTADASNVFSTSLQVTGRLYASNYAVPTPSNMTTAIGDMEIAFTDAAGRAAGVTELGQGDIGGMTLVPGVYKWGTGLLIPTDVTLSGSATDVWIFEIAQGLTLESGVRVHLTGGALPKNVFWQVSGQAELGTTAHLEGVLLCQTAIVLRTGASVVGRLLAQTAVTLDSSTIVEPAP